MAQDLVKLADQFVHDCQAIKTELSKVIVGQNDVIDEIIISIFCKGHSLLVGVPGLAKTLTVSSIAQILGLDFKRVQFTPDLMPSDITGAEILDQNKEFKFLKGPIFTNVLLADEINRTPPKTQSALLEAMQEKNVTIAGKSFKLEEPFFVLATQNPIEQEGTYPLPEAQQDRFMFNIKVDYPSEKEEYEIVKRTTQNERFELSAILSPEKIKLYQELIREIPITDNVLEFAVNLSRLSRPIEGNEYAQKYLSWGAGPRAAQYLVLGAKANAILNGKYSPDIEDVKAIAYSVLRHRILPNYKAEADGLSVEMIVNKLIEKAS